MVVFHAPSKQNHCEDIASDEGASEKNVRLFPRVRSKNHLINRGFGFVGDHHSQKHSKTETVPNALAFEWSIFAGLSSKMTMKTSRAPKARPRKFEGFSMCMIEKILNFPPNSALQVTTIHKSIRKLKMRQTHWLAKDRFSHASLAKRQRRRREHRRRERKK